MVEEVDVVDIVDFVEDVDVVVEVVDVGTGTFMRVGNTISESIKVVVSLFGKIIAA